MVSAATSRKLLPDERKFVAEALPTLAASILLRHDGKLIEKDIGVAHLAEAQTASLLDAYRRLKGSA